LLPPSSGRWALIALMMEVASTSEKSVNFYQNTRRNIPEVNYLPKKNNRLLHYLE
jgi:hypothetical protein